MSHLKANVVRPSCKHHHEHSQSCVDWHVWVQFMLWDPAQSKISQLWVNNATFYHPDLVLMCFAFRYAMMILWNMLDSLTWRPNASDEFPKMKLSNKHAWLTNCHLWVTWKQMLTVFPANIIMSIRSLVSIGMFEFMACLSSCFGTLHKVKFHRCGWTTRRFTIRIMFWCVLLSGMQWWSYGTC